MQLYLLQEPPEVPGRLQPLSRHPAMSRHPFDPGAFRSLSDLVVGHARFLRENVLNPFVARLSPLLQKVQSEVEALRATFLNRHPVEPFEAPGHVHFYAESTKRDIGASLRRYIIGVQTRAMHIRMRTAWTKEEHLAYAMELEHPHTLAGKALEPEWQFVFAQLAFAFAKFGVPDTIVRLDAYRARILDWVRELAKTVTPLQRQLNLEMPDGIREVAGHVNSVLFFLLLTVVGYPNPALAWRFFHGAPIVGEFYSSGLHQRTKVQGELSDAHLRKVAEECRQHCRSVTPKLEPAAAVKAMAKQQQDFDSGALKGPFPDRSAMIRAMQQHIRKNTSFRNFVIDPKLVIASPQFTVQELHAYNEAVASSTTEEELQWKVRNIFNAKRMNVLTSSFSTYIPNTHADVSVVILYYVQLLVQFGFTSYHILGWPADYKAAYRQMPIEILHCLFAGTCYYDYDPETGAPIGQKWAFYTSLPFGSSLAPAAWGEVVVGLAFILARLLLSIVTHCVDDVANFEIEELVGSARAAFLEINQLLGLVLDMDKSKPPMADFIYLGLRLLLPSTVTRSDLRLQVPDKRRKKLLQQIRAICDANELTSGQAASMRGRLYFYMAWFVACRGFLSYLACRQYSSDADVTLNQDLRKAFEYFTNMLESSRFCEGICPGRFFLGRTVAWLYTDGSREPGPYEHSFETRGIGGVVFPSHSEQPVWYGESLHPTLPGFDAIAAIEMFAIWRALKLFPNELRGKALFLFCDNTHAVGCLLRRGASLKNTNTKTVNWYGRPSPQEEFLQLSDDLRYTMNMLAQEIWKMFDELDVVVWIEYIWTEVNLADPPSRGEAPPTPYQPGRRVGEDFHSWVSFGEGSSLGFKQLQPSASP